MKTLVVFYSRSGNTKKIAEKISDKMKSDIEELIDIKNRKGLFGWFSAVRDARSKKLTTINVIKNDPAKYGLVIIGTPIWAGLMAPAVRTYINQNKAKFKNVAFFCTYIGSGDLKAFNDMEDFTGMTHVSKFGLREKELNTNHEDKLNNFIKSIK